ncbi:hypothetical protein PO909_030009 [Leuciscus waleckii]
MPDDGIADDHSIAFLFAKRGEAVSLGNSLVQVPKRLYQRLSGRRTSLFTQELATLVFGRETLAKATLTGKDAVRERFPNTEVAEIRALLRRKCNNESYKASSNSSQS